MIGGIFETIGKTLGVGKEKYFLELDDAAEETAKGIKKSAAAAAKTAKSALETAKEATIEVAEKAQEIVSDTTDDAKDQAKSAADDLSKKANEVADKTAETGKKTAAKAKQTATKATAKGKAAAKDATSEEAVETLAQPATSATPSPEDLILQAIASTEPKKQTDGDGNTLAEIKNFSTDYLMTPSRAKRRRPGPSLSPFKGMANEVNPRLKS